MDYHVEIYIEGEGEGAGLPLPRLRQKLPNASVTQNSDNITMKSIRCVSSPIGSAYIHLDAKRLEFTA